MGRVKEWKGEGKERKEKRKGIERCFFFVRTLDIPSLHPLSYLSRTFTTSPVR